MKSLFFSITLLACTFIQAQTQGTLSFSFTQTAHTSYTGNKNVLAVWIQSSTGTFIKTRLRYAGGGTADHLPTWAVNSGGTANNALGTSCNVVSAATGATLTNFSAKNVSWDGVGCSISQASTSIAADLMIGKNLDQALVIVESFSDLMSSKGTKAGDEEILEDGVALAGVSKFPARIKCALLGWMAFKDAAIQSSKN